MTVQQKKSKDLQCYPSINQKKKKTGVSEYLKYIAQAILPWCCSFSDSHYSTVYVIHIYLKRLWKGI